MLALQMSFGISLMVAGSAGKYNALRNFFVALAPYFFSFFPVVLLIYSLYEVSKLF